MGLTEGQKGRIREAFSLTKTEDRGFTLRTNVREQGANLAFAFYARHSGRLMQGIKRETYEANKAEIDRLREEGEMEGQKEGWDGRRQLVTEQCKDRWGRRDRFSSPLRRAAGSEDQETQEVTINELQ